MHFFGERKEQDLEVGIAYYTKESWQRLREQFPADTTLDTSYEDWLEGVGTFVQEAAVRGQKIRQVWIDVDELAKWCETNGRRMDNTARSEFVVTKLKQYSLLQKD